MHTIKFAAFALMGTALASCSSANYSVAPIPEASQQIRYDRGTPTTYSEMDKGALQVTALGVGKGHRLTFGVAAYNKSNVPSNFGVENISIEEEDGTHDQVFTSGQLVHEANVHATWAKIGTAVAGGLAAAAAQNNAYSTTTGYVGHTSFYARTYDPAVAYAGVAAASAATGYGIASIQNKLDHTVASIQNNALQTTTIDPDDSYGGKVVAGALASKEYPQNITMHVNWNGDNHVFRFAVGKGDVPPPVPASVAQTTPAPRRMIAAQTAASSPKPAPTEYKRLDDWSGKSTN